MGNVLDPFFETEIATFNEEGLIKELKAYSCWSPMVRIVQDKAGVWLNTVTDFQTPVHCSVSCTHSIVH